jgi:hypothetical protein
MRITVCYVDIKSVMLLILLLTRIVFNSILHIKAMTGKIFQDTISVCVYFVYFTFILNVLYTLFMYVHKIRVSGICIPMYHLKNSHSVITCEMKIFYKATFSTNIHFTQKDLKQ